MYLYIYIYMFIYMYMFIYHHPTAQHTEGAGRHLPQAGQQDCVQALTHIYAHARANTHAHTYI